MKRLAYLGCIMLLLCIAACSKDIVDTTGNIVGTVRDARTNNFLEGVSVTLKEEGASMTTGTDGRFSFLNKDSQKTYTINVSKAGYKSDSKTVFLKSGEDNVLDFSLTPSVSILGLSLSNLDFGSVTTTLTFDIKNTGSAPLTWSISEDVSWISCSPISGTTQAGETSAVVVNVNREGLDRGNYSQTIAVSSNGGSDVIRINMVVQGISVSFFPETLDFGSTTTSMQLTLTNNGSGTVSYTATPSNEWIKLDKKTGVFTSAEYLNVSVDRTTFSPGDYSGSIAVKVNNDDVVIPVRMNIPTKEKPTITLYSVDETTYNSAKFRGAIASIGSSKVTRHGFCWNTTGEPTLDNAQTSNLGDCSIAKDFTYNATSLNANTTYYVRAYAENQEGVSYSNEIKFKTTGTPEKPTVETGVVSGIQTTQVTVSGNIISLGNVEEITQYGHTWSTKANATINDNRTEQGHTKQTGSYNSTITDLSPNTTYHVRAYATNTIGTTYGEDVAFTTALGDVELRTGYAKDITFNTATIEGTIITSGGHTITEQGICWSTTVNPYAGGNAKISISTTEYFTITLTGLMEKTKYYARTYAKTLTGQTFYGNEITFTTNEKSVKFNKDSYGNENNWSK